MARNIALAVILDVVDVTEQSVLYFKNSPCFYGTSLWFYCSAKEKCGLPHADAHETRKCSTAGLIPNFTKIGK